MFQEKFDNCPISPQIPFLFSGLLTVKMQKLGNCLELIVGQSGAIVYDPFHFLLTETLLLHGNSAV